MSDLRLRACLLKAEQQLAQHKAGLGDEEVLRWALLMLAKECVRYEREIPYGSAGCAARSSR